MPTNHTIGGTQPCIIPALDVLIGDPDILSPKPETAKIADHLYIPINYIDRLGKFNSEYGQSTRRESSHILLGVIGKMLEAINHGDPKKPYYACANGMRVEFRSPQTTDHAALGSKQSAITLAQELKIAAENGHHNEVSIMTGDNHMIAKAAEAKIEVTHVNPKIYTGHRKVTLPTDAISLWENGKKRITKAEWDEIFPKEEPLCANEFVELEYPYMGQTRNNFSNIGRYDVDTECLVHLKYINFNEIANFNRIRPRTPLQAMYMESLMAPPEKIPIVVMGSVFGTGKTFMPIAAGLYGVGYSPNPRPDYSPRYKRIFICPRDGALGKDIGFLPGGVTDKVMAKALPIIDNLEEILNIIRDEPIINVPEQIDEFSGNKSGKKARKNKEKAYNSSNKAKANQILSQYFEFQPVINMGGRSILRSLIFFDESQDFELYQIRELATRFGEGSKIVFAGDPTQLSNPHLSYNSNGLSYIASKLADSPYAAVLFDNNPENIVRHWALKEIAKAFGTYQ
ncbi:PhoH family protein [Candidatus Saccharibacteria bacterium]|nr:PhoH family protein [Candidatus Saccharibacteria bacterium]